MNSLSIFCNEKFPAPKIYYKGREINPYSSGDWYSKHWYSKRGQKPIVCEICGEEITEENESDDEENRCLDCYEEWGSQWPDRV